MGVTNSKCERRSDAVRLCKERKRFLKQAIDSRCALAAAHISYIQSLRNLGIGLRKYAESEFSISAIDPDKNPSPMARVSYMRTGESSALTVGVSLPARNMYVEEGEFSNPPPPPPPCPESGFSWDFFDPIDESDNYSGLNMNLDHVKMCDDFGEKNETHGISKPEAPRNELVVYNAKSASLEQSNLKRNKSPLDEDTSVDTEFVTHMSKDFLSTIKEVDSLFFRASESGKDVSRMLESNKIRIESRGKLPASVYLTSFGAVCCQGRNVNVPDGTYIGRTTNDDNEDSASDFIEDLCMISGSHSSTLDRMHAWERKLYDEVKASEFIRNEYDRKCDKLRHQFAKDLSPESIDKTRSIVRDLHSRISVALHAVDSISKRIEKMSDEELLPQVLELIQGLTQMWKSMVDCHHLQHIITSLVHHSKGFSGSLNSETQKQSITQLQDEVESFRLSFIAWISRYILYVEALNGWLQICILQPRERYRGRRAFSPHRVLSPPIIVLYRDWSTGVKSLPAGEVSNAIRVLLSNLQRSVRRIDMQKHEEIESKDEGKNDDLFNFSCIQTSLAEVFDRLTKFSEASVKLCEDIHQKCEAARNAYNNYKATPRSISI